MDELNDDFIEVSSLVKDRPEDYAVEKDKILAQIRSYITTDEVDLLNEWLHNYIYELPQNGAWKRRHIYLLTHDLLQYADLHPGLDAILYDVESSIIGDCEPEDIHHYPGEPDSRNELTAFVQGYDWLDS